MELTFEQSLSRNCCTFEQDPMAKKWPKREGNGGWWSRPGGNAKHENPPVVFSGAFGTEGKENHSAQWLLVLLKVHNFDFVSRVSEFYKDRHGCSGKIFFFFAKAFRFRHRPAAIKGPCHGMDRALLACMNRSRPFQTLLLFKKTHLYVLWGYYEYFANKIV